MRGDGVEEREVDDGSFMVVGDGTKVGKAVLLGIWEERRDSKAFNIGWRGVLAYLSKVRDGKSIIV